LPQTWCDIDDPGVWRKPEPETPTKPATGFDDSPPAPPEPLAKEYRFKDVSIMEPAQGFEKNKPFDMDGEIEPFDKSKPISASKILLYPIGVYNGQEDKFAPGGIEADLDQETGKFRATCKSLFDPQPYANDTSKPADATWKLYVRAEGGAAEKPMESERLTFPKESQFVELKKGDYDEDGAKTFNKPQSGDNFKPNGVVKSLQGDLIKTLFLPKDSDDGFFGDQTDKAVREFQGYAIKTERMKRSAGKTEKTNKPLDVPQPDGVVEKKARDELDRWLQSEWVKPIPTLRHGEYDDTGVSNGKGKRGTDDHHEGTPVVDAQKDLQKVSVYVDCVIDGWFSDKMLDAVKLFQEAAVKGEFIINGALTDIGEKLTGHSKGELCPKTQEFLKKVAEKGGKVPPKPANSFDIDKAIEYLKRTSVPPYGKGECATHVRKGLFTGGIDITPHPVPAKEYGPYLEKYGFEEISTNEYNPIKGDIIIMQSFSGASSNYGHIEMYSGTQWISDFIQDDLYPGSKYKENKAEYHIYRWKVANK
jgi:hypothetical protein